MSRVYEALKQLERHNGESGRREGGSIGQLTAVLPADNQNHEGFAFDSSDDIHVIPKHEARLVALCEPKSLGAEKFRALATRIENIRQQKQIKAIQVISSTINEGKTLVAANLSITLASRNGARVLLLEGDLHRPTLAGLLSQKSIKGLKEWWSATDQDISKVMYHIEGTRLWFISAGGDHESPSGVLQSSQFAEAFQALRASFDWIIVDSTPMLPVSDVNLWSRLVDGTLLVVREGIAPVSALEKGLASLDNPKLIGTVLNAAKEAQGAGYSNGYYGLKLPRYRDTNS